MFMLGGGLSGPSRSRLHPLSSSILAASPEDKDVTKGGGGGFVDQRNVTLRGAVLPILGQGEKGRGRNPRFSPFIGGKSNFCA